MAAEVNVSRRVHVPCSSIVEQLVGYEAITSGGVHVHCSSVTEQLVGLWLLTCFFYTGARQQCV